MARKIRMRRSRERNLKDTWFEDREGYCWYFDTDCPPYDRHIDIDRMEMDTSSAEEPTLNTLCQREWREKHCYEEYGICYGLFGSNRGVTKEDIDTNEMKAFLKKRGWNVSKRALDYVVGNWLKGLKSAFRDNIGGVHVSCANGGNNPLSLRLTTLHDLCKEWQVTYKG